MLGLAIDPCPWAGSPVTQEQRKAQRRAVRKPMQAVDKYRARGSRTRRSRVADARMALLDDIRSDCKRCAIDNCAVTVGVSHLFAV